MRKWEDRFSDRFALALISTTLCLPRDRGRLGREQGRLNPCCATPALKPLFDQFPTGNLPLYEAYRAHLAAWCDRRGRARAILREASAIIENTRCGS